MDSRKLIHKATGGLGMIYQIIRRDVLTLPKLHSEIMKLIFGINATETQRLLGKYGMETCAPLHSRYVLERVIAQYAEFRLVNGTDLWFGGSHGVTIKVMRWTESNEQQMRQECATAKALSDHGAHFVHLLCPSEIFRTGTMLCMVYDRFEKPITERYDLSIRSLRLIAFQLFSALSLLGIHDRTHSRLRPACILINEEKSPQIGVINLLDTSDPLRDPYLSPELMAHLEGGTTTHQSDVWAAGMILAELYLGSPVLDAKSFSTDIGAMENISFATLSQKLSYPQCPEFINLLLRCFEWAPQRRISAFDALHHPFFAPISPFSLFSVPPPTKQRQSHTKQIKKSPTKHHIENSPLENAILDDSPIVMVKEKEVPPQKKNVEEELTLPIHTHIVKRKFRIQLLPPLIDRFPSTPQQANSEKEEKFPTEISTHRNQNDDNHIDKYEQIDDNPSGESFLAPEEANSPSCVSSNPTIVNDVRLNVHHSTLPSTIVPDIVDDSLQVQDDFQIPSEYDDDTIDKNEHIDDNPSEESIQDPNELSQPNSNPICVSTNPTIVQDVRLNVHHSTLPSTIVSDIVDDSPQLQDDFQIPSEYDDDTIDKNEHIDDEESIQDPNELSQQHSPILVSSDPTIVHDVRLNVHHSNPPSILRDIQLNVDDSPQVQDDSRIPSQNNGSLHQLDTDHDEEPELDLPLDHHLVDFTSNQDVLNSEKPDESEDISDIVLAHDEPDLNIDPINNGQKQVVTPPDQHESDRSEEASSPFTNIILANEEDLDLFCDQYEWRSNDNEDQQHEYHSSSSSSSSSSSTSSDSPHRGPSKKQKLGGEESSFGLIPSSHLEYPLRNPWRDEPALFDDDIEESASSLPPITSRFTRFPQPRPRLNYHFNYTPTFSAKRPQRVRKPPGQWWKGISD